MIFESGRQVSIPTSHLHLRNDGTYYLDLTVDPRPADSPVSAVAPAVTPTETPVASSDIVIPRIEEQATITRRKVETGRVRVSKTISEDPVTIDEPTIHEEYTVERVPVNRIVTETEGVRVEGDMTIIPVYEEQTVTIKRLVLREEIHLTKTRREEHKPQTILLRKETIEIERTP